MEETKKDIVTKQDIIDYVSSMKFKKSIRGYDRQDVYGHIQEIVRRYDAYMGLKLEDQKLELTDKLRKEISSDVTETEGEVQCNEELLAELEALKRELEATQNELVLVKSELEASQNELDFAKSELDSTRSELAQIAAECEASRLMAKDSDLQDGCSSCVSLDTTQAELESNTLEACAEEEEMLSSKTPIEVEKTTYDDTRSIPYSDEIRNILHEARMQADRIVQAAREETEREMVKVLQLRAQFKQDQGLYQNWCTKVEIGKRTIEDFIVNLNSQYDMMTQAVISMKEGTESNHVNELLVDFQERKEAMQDRG